MAAFTDGGRTVDRTNWPHTFISYYPFGGAIALALDLSLRERPTAACRSTTTCARCGAYTASRAAAAKATSIVRTSIADAEARLAEVSGDARLPATSSRATSRGSEVADYAGLLQRAGFRLRKSAPGRAWLGDVRFDDRSGTVRLASPPPFGSPVYAAGIDVDDEIRQFDGTRTRSFADIAAVLGRRRPGDRASIVFADRAGRQRTATSRSQKIPRSNSFPSNATEPR